VLGGLRELGELSAEGWVLLGAALPLATEPAHVVHRDAEPTEELCLVVGRRDGSEQPDPGRRIVLDG
jgi:hypothetical protein